MILKRIEITLTGPDDYPADEGSYEKWEARERYVLGVLDAEAEWFSLRVKRKLHDPEFEIEILGLESGVSAPSDAPDHV